MAALSQKNVREVVWCHVKTNSRIPSGKSAAQLDTITIMLARVGAFMMTYMHMATAIIMMTTTMVTITITRGIPVRQTRGEVKQGYCWLRSDVPLIMHGITTRFSRRQCARAIPSWMCAGPSRLSGFAQSCDSAAAVVNPWRKHWPG